MTIQENYPETPAVTDLRNKIRSGLNPVRLKLAQASSRADGVADEGSAWRKIRPQITELFEDSLQSSLNHQMSVLSCLSNAERTTDRFYRLLQHNWQKIIEAVRKNGGEIETGYPEKQPTFRMIEDIVRIISPAFPKIQKGFSDVLGPSLGCYDSNIRPAGAMSEENRKRLFQVLGFPEDPKDWMERVVDTGMEKMLQALNEEYNHLGPNLSEGKNPDKYFGRHSLIAWKSLANSRLTTEQVTIRMSEAERLYTIGCLESIDFLCPEMIAPLQQVKLAFGSAHAATVPSLSESGFRLWSIYWKRLPKITQDPNGREPTQYLPIPPSECGFEIMASDFLMRIKHISWEDARILSKSLYDVTHNISVNYDGLHLISEAVLLKLLRGSSGIPHAIISSSVLAKTGLPWLPPADGSLALHSPKVSTEIALGKVGLL